MEAARIEARPSGSKACASAEGDEAERQGLLAPPSPMEPPLVPAPAALRGEAALYTHRAGRHEPWGGGRCLAVRGSDAACDMTWVSALLVLVPVGGWLGAVLPALWSISLPAKLLSLLTVGSCAASIAFLLAAKLTEPGILPTTLVDDSEAEADDAPRGSSSWESGMAPPTARGKHHRILLRGRRYHLIQLRAKFCRETGNCVESFDHYCPWVGNAVG